MKKYLKYIISGAVIICLVCACLIYTRPQTIEQRYPYLSVSDCTEISGYYYAYTSSDTDDMEFNIGADDEHFSELIELVQSAKFKTRLTNILPHTIDTHQLSDGDFKWELMLKFDNLSFPSGDTGSGYILHITNFFGKLSFSFDGEETLCSVNDQEQWVENIMNLISQQ